MTSRVLGGLVAVGMFLFAACGDDTVARQDAQVAVDAAAADGPRADGPAADASLPDAAPAGSVTIRVSGVTGATGKVILVGVGGFQGAVCEPVTGDPMSFAAVARTPSAGNPCDLGAAVVFADGTYDVMGGIYTPGNQTPDLCANTTVTVAGTGDVTLPAFGACP